MTLVCFKEQKFWKLDIYYLEILLMKELQFWEQKVYGIRKKIYGEISSCKFI